MWLPCGYCVVAHKQFAETFVRKVSVMVIGSILFSSALQRVHTSCFTDALIHNIMVHTHTHTHTHTNTHSIFVALTLAWSVFNCWLSSVKFKCMNYSMCKCTLGCCSNYSGAFLSSTISQDQELASLNVRVSQLDSELTESRQQAELNQEEVRRLRNELDDAKNKVASLETRNQELSTEMERVRAENAERSNITKEVSQRSEELSAVAEELRQCRAENYTLSANVETLTAEVERERARAVEYQDRLVGGTWLYMYQGTRVLATHSTMQ